MKAFRLVPLLTPVKSCWTVPKSPKLKNISEDLAY